MKTTSGERANKEDHLFPSATFMLKDCKRHALSLCNLSNATLQPHVKTPVIPDTRQVE
jgi:hypothetical protein